MGCALLFLLRGHTLMYGEATENKQGLRLAVTHTVVTKNDATFQQSLTFFNGQPCTQVMTWAYSKSGQSRLLRTPLNLAYMRQNCGDSSLLLMVPGYIGLPQTKCRECQILPFLVVVGMLRKAQATVYAHDMYD